jgi:hypothetical protein
VSGRSPLRRGRAPARPPSAPLSRGSPAASERAARLSSSEGTVELRSLHAVFRAKNSPGRKFSATHICPQSHPFRQRSEDRRTRPRHGDRRRHLRRPGRFRPRTGHLLDRERAAAEALAVLYKARSDLLEAKADAKARLAETAEEGSSPPTWSLASKRLSGWRRRGWVRDGGDGRGFGARAAGGGGVRGRSGWGRRCSGRCGWPSPGTEGFQGDGVGTGGGRTPVTAPRERRHIRPDR